MIGTPRQLIAFLSVTALWLIHADSIYALLIPICVLSLLCISKNAKLRTYVLLSYATLMFYVLTQGTSYLLTDSDDGRYFNTAHSISINTPLFEQLNPFKYSYIERVNYASGFVSPNLGYYKLLGLELSLLPGSDYTTGIHINAIMYLITSWVLAKFIPDKDLGRNKSIYLFVLWASFCMNLAVLQSITSLRKDAAIWFLLAIILIFTKKNLIALAVIAVSILCTFRFFYIGILPIILVNKFSKNGSKAELYVTRFSAIALLVSVISLSFMPFFMGYISTDSNLDGVEWIKTSIGASGYLRNYGLGRIFFVFLNQFPILTEGPAILLHSGTLFLFHIFCIFAFAYTMYRAICKSTIIRFLPMFYFFTLSATLSIASAKFLQADFLFEPRYAAPMFMLLFVVVCDLLSDISLSDAKLLTNDFHK